MTKLRSIAWNVDEDTYRADKALSYSTLAKYKREGFKGLSHLFDKVESPSLTLGSAVDSLITGGQEEFEDSFLVADFTPIGDSLRKVVGYLYERYGTLIPLLGKLNDDAIIKATELLKYQLNWRPETRARVVKEQGREYYSLLGLSKDRIILDTVTYNVARNMVNALKTSESTKYYFQEDNPFDKVRRYYQLKFKATLSNIPYRCMADLLLVDYKLKTITPIDLKTSHKSEYEFFKSFVEWDYQIQARLYWRIIRDNLDRDDYFKEFTLLPYRFIVVSRNCTPLVWLYDKTTYIGTYHTGKFNHIEMPDPEEIGQELYYYLNNSSTFPKGIHELGENSLTDWLKNYE